MFANAPAITMIPVVDVTRADAFYRGALGLAPYAVDAPYGIFMGRARARASAFISAGRAWPTTPSALSSCRIWKGSSTRWRPKAWRWSSMISPA
jgi:hypothetical protein